MTDFDETRHEPRPGRHRAPDDADDATTASDSFAPRADYRDDDFRDDAVVGAGAGAGAAGTGAGATGAGSGTGGGMPLRGLAMVLIFIGVCLMGWGLYAWTSGTDDDAAAGSGDDGIRAEAGQNPANARDDAPAPAEGDAEPAAPAEGRPDAEDPDPAQAEPDDAATDDEGIRRGDFRITVLNNSNVAGLAADVSDDLSGQGWGRGETGNAPEGNVGVFERTTVVYTPGNDAERAAAEEIARERGWAVEPRGENLDGKPGGVLVVVTEDAR